MENLVMVSRDQCYSDNNGAYDVYTLLNTQTRELVRESDSDQSPLNTEGFKRASADQKSIAAKVFAQNQKNEQKEMIGSTYIVGGSRKVAKGTEVLVLGYYAGGYRDTAVVTVRDGQGNVNDISPNCLKTFISCAQPWWA